MKVLRTHKLGKEPDIRWEDASDPTPARGQVVVEIEAAGINPVDVYVSTQGYMGIEPPLIGGMDAAGTIAAIGEGVEGWEVGDRCIVVATTEGKLKGAYAEQCVCWVNDPGDEQVVWPQVWPLPQGMSFAQGAAINVPYVTAFRALFEFGKAKAGQSVLVHGGTGGVGIAALQIAKAHGLRVWSTGGSEEGRELLKQQKADLVLDHTTDGYLDNLPNGGPDLILEMLANVNLGKDLTAIKQGGRIVVIGSRGETTINPRQLMAKQPEVTGMMYWAGGTVPIRRALDALVQGMSAGDIQPVIQAEIPMSEALRAFDLVMNGKSHGKVVLVP